MSETVTTGVGTIIGEVRFVPRCAGDPTLEIGVSPEAYEALRNLAEHEKQGSHVFHNLTPLLRKLRERLAALTKEGI